MTEDHEWYAKYRREVEAAYAEKRSGGYVEQSRMIRYYTRPIEAVQVREETIISIRPYWKPVTETEM